MASYTDDEFDDGSSMWAKATTRRVPSTASVPPEDTEEPVPTGQWTDNLQPDPPKPPLRGARGLSLFDTREPPVEEMGAPSEESVGTASFGGLTEMLAAGRQPPKPPNRGARAFLDVREPPPAVDSTPEPDPMTPASFGGLTSVKPQRAAPPNRGGRALLDVREPPAPTEPAADTSPVNGGSWFDSVPYRAPTDPAASSAWGMKARNAPDDFDPSARSAAIDRVRLRFAAPAAPGTLVDAVKATRLPKPFTNTPSLDNLDIGLDEATSGAPKSDFDIGLDENVLSVPEGIRDDSLKFVIPTRRAVRSGERNGPDDGSWTWLRDKKKPLPSSGASGLAAHMGGAGLDTTVKKLPTNAPARPSLPDKLDEAKVMKGADQGGVLPVDDDPRSMVAAQKKGDDVFDYSFITRAGEDAGAAWMNREPDYAASNRVARLAAEGKQRPIALAKAAQEDSDRAMRQKEMEANVKLRLAQADAAARGPQTKPMTPDEQRRERALADKAESDARRAEYEANNPDKTTPARDPSRFAIESKRAQLLREMDDREKKYRNIGTLIEALDAKLPDDPSQMPGSMAMAQARAGGLVERAGNWLGDATGAQSPEEQALAQDIVQLQTRLAQQVGQADSGLTLTAYEQDQLRKFMGFKFGDDPAKFYDALDVIRNALKRNTDGLYASYEGDEYLPISRLYSERNPSALRPNSPVFNGRKRAQNAPPVSTATPIGAPPTNAQVQSMVDGKAPASAQTVQVRRKSDGKVRRVPASEAQKWASDSRFEVL